MLLFFCIKLELLDEEGGAQSIKDVLGIVGIMADAKIERSDTYVSDDEVNYIDASRALNRSRPPHMLQRKNKRTEKVCCLCEQQ